MSENIYPIEHLKRRFRLVNLSRKPVFARRVERYIKEQEGYAVKPLYTHVVCVKITPDEIDTLYEERCMPSSYNHRGLLIGLDSLLLAIQAYAVNAGMDANWPAIYYDPVSEQIFYPTEEV